jgi:polyisoprenyl-phosphate glycosyltransferase
MGAGPLPIPRRHGPTASSDGTLRPPASRNLAGTPVSIRRVTGTEIAPVGSERIDVSVVLPVYNEKGHLRLEIDRIRAALDASRYSYELIVVDDGSDDGSEIELAALSGIRLIRHPANRGTGSARRTGTLAARGRVVVWTDADMTYPNDEIPALVKEMEGYDHVVGARTTEEGTTKILRVPAKWFIRSLAGYLVQTKIPDLNSGLRAFRRDVALQYLHLLPPGFSCVTTLTMSFLGNGYSVKYVPIEYRPRAGRSKFHWWRDTKRYLLQVIRMVLSYSPLRVFMPIGFALMAVGVVKLGYDWTARDFSLAANTLLILFAAFQTITIGLIADLVVRTSKPSDQVPPA